MIEKVPDYNLNKKSLTLIIFQEKRGYHRYLFFFPKKQLPTTLDE